MKAKYQMALPVLAGIILAPAWTWADTPGEIPAETRRQIDRDLKELGDQIDKLRAGDGIFGANHDLRADAAVFHKAIAWALRYDAKFNAADVASIQKAIKRGQERVKSLMAEKAPWSRKKGKLIRGYISEVDGSVQPFGLIVPAGYNPAKPMRLDVVLHGSTRPVGMSELRFMSRFDEGDEAGSPGPTQDFIELHPLGRVETCYRWAGETDVFEAIDAVCRNYNIDRDRIVLRGMSMGASGTWHLGLKHPDRFVALGPYCGYVDTHQFSQTPLNNFIKVGPLPEHQEKALHMLDSIDYAANAGVVPAIACMGDKDVFFQAHVLMGQAMAKEGLKMVNLISHGTGHVIDPVTHKEQMRRIGEYAAKGLDHAPKHVRFVTWTLKYSRCHWLQILGLGEHYARAEIEADATADGRVAINEPKNVTRFAILPPMLQGDNARLRVGETEIKLPANPQGERKPVIGRKNGKWVYLGELNTVTMSGKRPGLQGPIDDAFTAPFLCVRGAGKPWNKTVQAWSEANLNRFAYEWNRYFRGELPVKNDTDVTDEDLRRFNLILFGDPGSNRWIGRIQGDLPIHWTRDQLQVGGESFSAADHVPVLIQPNPLPIAKGHYVVINSGHTFHEQELASLNYLLFPRLGDWAVLKIGNKTPANPSDALDEKVIKAGYFNEQWRLPQKSNE